MAGGYTGQEDEITGINVTPLVDVVLVLLIIFMVTASFIMRQSVQVEVPQTKHAGKATPGLVDLTLDRQGTLYLDGAELPEALLAKRIAQVLAQHADARAVISADQSLPYGRVMHLLDEVKGAGITRFALSIRKDVSPPAAK